MKKALIASAATEEFFAAGEVALIMQIGSLLEDYTSGKARQSIEKLIRITPQTARVLRGGTEAEIPVEAADAILVNDDIRRLPYLFDLMRRVMRKVHVNIIASLVINLTAVVLSALGVLSPVTGALWHNCGSVFVVVNAALLLRLKDEYPPCGVSAAGNNTSPLAKEQVPWQAG